MSACLDVYLLQGGYPALQSRQLDPQRYYADYVATYVERDVRSLKTVQGRIDQPIRKVVLYGGSLSAERSEANLVGWRDVALAG